MRSVDNFAAAGTGGFRRSRLSAIFWLTLLLALQTGGFSQQSGSGVGTQPPTTSRHGFPEVDPSPLSPVDDYNPMDSEKRLHMINVERHRSLVADTGRLVALVTELNNEIAKSNTGDLSPAQLHKVEEIEKLAHSVKDKMVMSVRGPSNIDSPVFMPTLH
jgi:hypothetical protein